MKQRMVFIACLLALLWAVFWLFVIVGESLAWHTPALVAAPWLGVGLLFVILALMPWRLEVTGRPSACRRRVVDRSRLCDLGAAARATLASRVITTEHGSPGVWLDVPPIGAQAISELNIANSLAVGPSCA